MDKKLGSPSGNRKFWGGHRILLPGGVGCKHWQGTSETGVKKDCFNCPFEDCIWDTTIGKDKKERYES